MMRCGTRLPTIRLIARQGLQDDPTFSITIPTVGPIGCEVASDGLPALLIGKICKNGETNFKNRSDALDMGLAQIGFGGPGFVAASGVYEKCCDCGGGIPISAAVTGDPHVQNMAGQKFDIMALGRFSFFSLSRVLETTKDEKVLLSLDGTIDRVGGLCRQTFIQNVSIAGSWISEAGEFQEIGLRVLQSVPKSKSLQIGFDDKWSTVSELPTDAEALKKQIIAEASEKQIVLKVHGLALDISVDQHNTWNFLDLKIQGVTSLDDDVRIGGLLAHDDFSEAVKAPDDCVKEKASARAQLVGPPFLSHVKLGAA